MQKQLINWLNSNDDHIKSSACLLEPIDARRGVGVRATQRIAKRQLLSRETSIAHAKVSVESNNETVCSHCLREAPKGRGDAIVTGVRKLQQCSACKYTRFCDATCSKQAWKAYHKNECAQLAKVGDGVTPSVLLLWRLARLYLSTAEASSSRIGHWLLLFVENSVPLDEMPEEQRRALGQSAQMVMVLLSNHPTWAPLCNDATVSLLERLASVIHHYAMEVSDTYYVTRAIALYGLCSMPNHACEANAVLLFGVHRTAYLFAIRDIEEGEEVTICYVNTELGTRERRRALRERYLFDCDCERCARNAAFLSGAADKVGSYLLCDRAEALHKCSVAACVGGLVRRAASSSGKSTRCNVCGTEAESPASAPSSFNVSADLSSYFISRQLCDEIMKTFMAMGESLSALRDFLSTTAIPALTTYFCGVREPVLISYLHNLISQAELGDVHALCLATHFLDALNRCAPDTVLGSGDFQLGFNAVEREYMRQNVELFKSKK